MAMAMGSSKLGDEEIQNLALKLQALLPHLNRRKPGNMNSTVYEAGEVLKETCDYIKKLQREVDDLSHRLWNHLDSMDPGLDFDILKHLLLTLNSQF